MQSRSILPFLLAGAVAACGASSDAPATPILPGGGRYPARIVALSGDVMPADRQIELVGYGGSGRSEVALLPFRVVDAAGNGVPGVSVEFAAQSVQAVTLTSPRVVSDTAGVVIAAVHAGPQPTTLRIIATVAGTPMSAISDPIKVSFAFPGQAALSIDPELRYVEALDVDGSAALTISLVDQFTGPVSGAVATVRASTGSIGGGAGSCTIVQGACTVTWRPPLVGRTGGVTTIVATTNYGGALVSGSVDFYVSGSSATVLQVDRDLATGLVRGRLTTGGPITLTSDASCSLRWFTIEVVDRNGNPMPEGTSIAVVNLANASAEVSPDQVRYAGIFVGADRGTLHTVTATPVGCVTNGKSSSTGSFDLRVRSPKGTETLTRVNLGSFPTG